MTDRNRLPWAGFLCACLALLWTGGCATPDADKGNGEPTPDPRLMQVESLLHDGKLTDALVRCVDLAREDPNMPGLAEVQTEIAQEIADRRLQRAQARRPVTFTTAEADLNEMRNIPDTFRLRRPVKGQDTPLRAASTRMQDVLNKTVTVHLDGANLETFILALGESEDVNIIADADLAADMAMTVHADEVPLKEILDYVARNLGIAFHVGENVIWATQRAEGDSDTPLEVRVYRLRKGDPGLTVASGDDAAPDNDQFAEAHVLLMEAINRFVPQVTGADFLYNKNAHVLIVKNTKGNHALIEDLVAALDVTPPQVHIEARFISVRVSNLRELGIDWLLNSPYTVTTKRALRNNVVTEVPKTRIDSGAAISFPPPVNVGDGLNLTYQGLLTDPMFEAVLHALEESGKARALSVPRLTTVNNHEARIHVGEKFLYYDQFRTITSSERIPGDVNNNDIVVQNQILVPDGNPKEVELGISLGVNPSVGADLRTITLALNPHIENFVRYEVFEVFSGNPNNNLNNAGTSTNNTGATSVIRLPIFEQNDITTKVVVQSGETVVMGGIISTTEQKTDRGVPVLSKIPLLGRLFQSEEFEQVDENLLIFVTATILSERGEDLIPISPEDRSAGEE